MPAEPLESAFDSTALAEAMPALVHALDRTATDRLHGDLPRWRAALDRLPPIVAPRFDASGSVVSGRSGAADTGAVRDVLSALMPWRKGPFELDDILVDAEWRSDLKWDRLLPHIAPLAGRCVLDIGSGSGYHLWRMRAAGASAVLGIEPMLLFDAQFRSVAHYAQDAAVQQLPLRLQDLPPRLGVDTAFSMGVLYHTQRPAAHLETLMHALRPGGQCVLETLVIGDEVDTTLTIDKRYAGMRNLHEIPSVARVERWLRQAGFERVRCVSRSFTGVEEQRSTAWSGDRSLVDALDADDPTRTIEGHPAPLRAVFLGEVPVTG